MTYELEVSDDRTILGALVLSGRLSEAGEIEEAEAMWAWAMKEIERCVEIVGRQAANWHLLDDDARSEAQEGIEGLREVLDFLIAL